MAAAKGERRAAIARANPELELSAGEKKITAGGLSDEGMAWSVSLQQSFEWPGRIPLRKAIANQQIRLAELGLAQFRAALASRARTLAFNCVAAQEKSAAAKEVADRFQQLREVLVQRDPAGLTPQLEMRIIEATELTFQRQATEAALAAQEARLELNYLRGGHWAAPINIEPVELTFQPTPVIATLIAASRTNNFELQMRRVELEQQGFKVSLTRKEGYPSFAVGPYFSHERAGDGEQQVGFGISIPLPLWNRNKGNVEIAEARLKQAETLLHVAERELDRRIVENEMIYQTQLSEMAKWHSESIGEFRQAAALAVPDITGVQVQVNTEVPALAAE